MRVMQFPLIILTIAGCWLPDSWSSLCKRIVYNIYTIFVSLLLLTFMVPQLMDIILNVDNADDFTETFYVMLALVLACCKMLSLYLNRKNIEILTNALVQEPFKPLGSDEIAIRQKFDNLVHNNSVQYTIMVETTCAFMVITPIFTKFRRGDLTYREWIPYEYSSNVLFCIIYFRQLIGLAAASIVNVACDSVICGFLQHICCQFEILECRLKKSLHNQGAQLGECVCQHRLIYKYAYTINEKFKFIIAVQFTVSMLVVCSNLYQLAKATVITNYIPLLFYTPCMLTQILIYCWYGNEVKLKSVQFADEIFGMDWLTVDKKEKENLIMIMNRSLIPIEFSSIHIVTMNLDSFGKLLKASYSVYNILQRME